eukprot:UN19133
MQKHLKTTPPLIYGSLARKRYNFRLLRYRYHLKMLAIWY